MKFNRIFIHEFHNGLIEGIAIFHMFEDAVVGAKYTNQPTQHLDSAIFSVVLYHYHNLYDNVVGLLLQILHRCCGGFLLCLSEHTGVSLI